MLEYRDMRSGSDITASHDRSRRLFPFWCCAGAALLVFLLALLVLPLDKPISNGFIAIGHRWKHGTVFPELLAVFRCAGKGDVLIFLALLAGLCRWRRRGKQLLLALLITSAMVWSVKVTVLRERPDGSNPFSFPSGDVAAVAAFSIPLVAANPYCAPLTGVATLAVAAARMLVGKHYPSDVLAAVAVALLGGALALYPRLWRRLRIRRRWFAAAALLLLLERGAEHAILNTSDSGAFMDFLAIYGPALALAIVAFRGPVWAAARRIRRKRDGLPSRPLPAPMIGLCAAVVILGLYAYAASSSTLWDRDEPRFAKATAEMLQTHNYLLPTFNGAPRLHKPILIYWLMSLPARAMGPSELAFRLPAVAAAVAACFLTFLLGARMFDRRTGLLAACVLAVTPLMMATGTMATTDAVLLAWTVGIFYLSWRYYTGSARFGHGLLLTMCFAGSWLTKGPVGPAVPLLAVVALALLPAPGQSRRYLGPIFLAAVSGTAVFLLWALPANMATGGEFLRIGLGRHVLERSVAPMEGHGGNLIVGLFYYVPVVLLAFFPWTLWLPAGVRAFRLSEGGEKPSFRFLGAWIVVVLLLMTAIATKLPHYVLPCWPAMAIVVAVAILRPGTRPLEAEGRRPDWGKWLFGSVGILVGAGLLVVPWFAPFPGLRGPTTAAGVLCLTITLVVLRRQARRRPPAMAWLLIAGVGFAQVLIATFVMPAFEVFKISKPLAQTVARVAPAGVPVALYKYYEPSLFFYMGRPHVTELATAESTAAWASRPKHGVLVCEEAAWGRVSPAVPAGRVKKIATFRGYNYSNAKWVTVLVLTRRPTEVPGG